MKTPKKGSLLVSEPYLEDPNFGRSVVLIVNSQSGHTGLILNKSTDVKLGEIIGIPNAEEIPVFMGGPVAPDTLHFLHCRPDLIEGGEHVCDNIYWGGNFEQVKTLIEENTINTEEFRFFIGYSGWSPHQLFGELKMESWFITDASKEYVFDNDNEMLWEKVLKSMGGKYEILVNSPKDPQWN